MLDYRRVAASAEGIADVMIYYVEQAVALAHDVGVDDGTVSSLPTMYRDAIDHVVKHDLREQFIERSRRIAQRDFGYGLSEAMMDFHATRPEDEDDEEEEHDE